MSGYAALLAASGLLAALPSPGSAASPAQDWIATQSGAAAHWTDHGPLALGSGKMFFGDPTWGDDYHIRDPQPAPAPQLQVWTLDAPDRQARVVWLEATGAAPARRGNSADFGMDAAMFALGDLAAGQALVALGETLQAQNKGDSFEWIQPHIDMPNPYAKWLTIPPGQQPMFLVGTGNDGSLSAVWLTDADGATSGIMIDIAGRASDGRYIDLQLPR